MSRIASLAAVVVLFLASSLYADWPQFRGPDGQGHAGEIGLPLELAPESAAWSIAIPGQGWSSPVVSNGKIWLTTALDEGHSLQLLCYAAETGKLLHQLELFAPKEPVELHATNSYASPSPVVAEGHIFATFGSMGTACVDANSGEVVWRNDEIKINHMTGPGSSPAYYRGLLILNFDGADFQFVVALDAKTGKQVWKTERSGPLREKEDTHRAFSTPLIITADGRDQLISIGADQTHAYDPLTGEELWHVEYIGFSTVPRPIFGHGLVYITTGFAKPQLMAIRPDGSGNVTDTHVEWSFNRQVPTKPSPLLVDDRIYLVTEKGVGTCVDAATGEMLWQARLGGNHSASPTLVDGRILICSEDGDLIQVEPAGEYKEITRSKFPGRFMASPAIADGAMFLRTDEKLYRFNGKPKGAEASLRNE